MLSLLKSIAAWFRKEEYKAFHSVISDINSIVGKLEGDAQTAAAKSAQLQAEAASKIAEASQHSDVAHQASALAAKVKALAN